MVRVVPLFVVVMLATIALIVLVSSIVMGVRFLFSNKRKTFGFLVAGFVLAILSFAVVTGAYMLNHRYERAEYHARLQYELSRSQAALSRQVQSEMHHHGVEIEHIVAERPIPPDPVRSLSSNSLTVSLEKERAAEDALKQLSEAQQAVEQPVVVEKPTLVDEVPSDQEQPAQLAAESTAIDSVDTPVAIEETDSDQSITGESGEPSPVDEESSVAGALESASIAKASNSEPASSLGDAKSSAPDWFRRGESLSEWKGTSAKVVASAKSDPRLRRLELELMTRNACLDQAMQIQDERAINVSNINVTDQMMDACQRDSYTVSKPLPGGGFEETVYQLLVFDDEFTVYVQDAVKNKDITRRLQTTTILSGIVLSSVTFLYGAFSFLAYWRRPKTA